MTTLPNLSGASAIAIDIETFDPDLKKLGPGVRRNGTIVGVAIAVPEGQSWYISLAHPESNNIDWEIFKHWARENLNNSNQPKVGANLLYDIDYLTHAGIPVSGLWYDVQIAEPLIDENARQYNLDALAQKYLGETKQASGIEQYCLDRGWKGKAQSHIYKMPASVVAPYAKADATQALRIFEKQKVILQRENLLPVFNLETKLLPMLLAMRQRGVRIDTEKADKIETALSLRLDLNRDNLYAIAETDINYNSSPQLAKLLEREGFILNLTAKGNPSVTKDYLESFPDSKTCKAILNCRKYEKMINTFVKGYIGKYTINGRIHALFNQLRSDEFGTVSGRFSSSHPNLQNIPARDPELGPMIRSMFIPDPGHMWLRQDYSQIELRIFAHYARGKGSEELRKNYQENKTFDMHSWCADLAGCSRDQAKIVNFGILYGMGKTALAKELKLNILEAESLLKQYHDAVPFAKKTLYNASNVANRRGYVKTILGRRRRFPIWESIDDHGIYGERSAVIARCLENNLSPIVQRQKTYKALNSVIQGTAADIMKKAMLDIWQSGICDKIGVPLLTVHDELDWSIPRDTKPELLAELDNIMENAIALNVPLYVDSLTGDHWGECK